MRGFWLWGELCLENGLVYPGGGRGQRRADSGLGLRDPWASHTLVSGTDVTLDCGGNGARKGMGLSSEASLLNCLCCCLFIVPLLLPKSQKQPSNSCKITHLQLIRV